MENLEIDAFLHCNDLTYLNNGEEELQKYKKGDKLKVKVLKLSLLIKKSGLVLDKLNRIHSIGLKIKKLTK